MALRLDRGFFIIFQLFEDLLPTEAFKANNIIHLGFLIDIPLINVFELDVTKCDSCRLPMVLYFKFG